MIVNGVPHLDESQPASHAKYVLVAVRLMRLPRLNETQCPNYSKTPMGHLRPATHVYRPLKFLSKFMGRGSR